MMISPNGKKNISLPFKIRLNRLIGGKSFKRMFKPLKDLILKNQIFIKWESINLLFILKRNLS